MGKRRVLIKGRVLVSIIVILSVLIDMSAAMDDRKKPKHNKDKHILSLSRTMSNSDVSVPSLSTRSISHSLSRSKSQSSAGSDSIPPLSKSKSVGFFALPKMPSPRGLRSPRIKETYDDAVIDKDNLIILLKYLSRKIKNQIKDEVSNAEARIQIEKEVNIASHENIEPSVLVEELKSRLSGIFRIESSSSTTETIFNQLLQIPVLTEFTDDNFYEVFDQALLESGSGANTIYLWANEFKMLLRKHPSLQGEPILSPFRSELMELRPEKIWEGVQKVLDGDGFELSVLEVVLNLLSFLLNYQDATLMGDVSFATVFSSIILGNPLASDSNTSFFVTLLNDYVGLGNNSDNLQEVPDDIL